MKGRLLDWPLDEIDAYHRLGSMTAEGGKPQFGDRAGYVRIAPIPIIAVRRGGA